MVCEMKDSRNRTRSISHWHSLRPASMMDPNTSNLKLSHMYECVENSAPRPKSDEKPMK